MNTADYLLENGLDRQPALLTKDTQITYGELRRACARLAGELLAKGVKPGQKVGILGENSLFWVASYLAALKIGAVATPLATVSTPEELQRKALFTEVSVMCAEKRWLRRFADAWTGETITEEALSTPGDSCWDAPQASFDRGQDAALMLTSGTTASPRAVRITHGNIQANTDGIIKYLDLNADERMLAALPFYYCFGTSLLHTHLRAGGSLALCNTFAYPETALDMIEAAQCTGMAGVPSTYQTLLRNTSFPRRSLPSLRKVQQAGGKLPVVFIEELMAALPHAQIFVMYGQTEATARLSYLPPQMLKTKTGSIGKGMPGVELIVVGEGGQPVRPGEVGEVVARGENISPGYYKEPQASAEKFVDGALRTGDLATVDEDRYIFIVDRKSDFIKSSGHRVSSQEVEAKILELQQVVSAAAVGVPDEILGEAIVVFVVLQFGAGLSAEEIIDYCKRNLARHMTPKQVIVVKALPVNANGKVMKAALRDLAARETEMGG